MKAVWRSVIGPFAQNHSTARSASGDRPRTVTSVDLEQAPLALGHAASIPDGESSVDRARGARSSSFVTIHHVHPHRSGPRAAIVLLQASPKAIGEECTLSGSDGCATGTCLKVEPGMPGRHICTTGCAPNGSLPCPAAWACVQVRAGEGGFFCVPPANWQPQVAALEPAGLRSPPALAVRPLPSSRDGGR